MLILYALARPLLAPDTAVLVNDTFATTDGSGFDHCNDIQRNCRTTEEIIYSCIAVVFICIWVAIHPNIPRKFSWSGREIVSNSEYPAVRSAVVTLQNILFMLLALIVPELIIMWAMQQWFAARAIAKKYAEKYNWTKTHGFFVVMGGFALYDRKKYLCTLEDKEWFTKKDRAAAINIDGKLEDVFIKGHLKGDEDQLDFEEERQAGEEGRQAVEEQADETEKLVIQEQAGEEQVVEEEESVGSTVYRLPDGSASCLLELLLQRELISVTEDEIKDRGKSDALSKFLAIGQTAWFIVQCIARGVEGISITNLEILTLAFALLNFGIYFFWLDKPQRVRFPIKINYQNQSSKEGGTARSVWDWFQAIGWEIRSDWKNLHDLNYPLLAITYPLWTLFIQSRNLVPGEPHYQSGLKKDPTRLYVPAISIAVILGAIHCIPWAFTFPSHTEQIMWRVCALVVTCFPVMGMFLLFIDDLYESTWGFCLLIVGGIIGPIFYGIARITLIILALMELRALPTSAHQTVEWSILIPHI
ncbi:hypothetical protein D9758_017249 [Tetrapyrgos nigripes]|uniref:Uncharacterized protein n=1 Tax=Tetrapyrgos nigripes TaxID=182062 RepID=A0A8H5C659_9AGAR|nr:hypothetical protein D9758_017249 [Tetrapyrgos nigripes]